MENFEDNLKLIKDWTNEAHIQLMNKINVENSLLELISNNTIKNIKQLKRTLL